MLPIIITGGPGAGKTTLIDALSASNYQTFDESSRQLIEEQSQLTNGVLPWVDLPEFARLCLVAMAKQKQQASQHEVAFLDRAIPDICGYLQQAGLEIAPHYLEESKGYHQQAFFCRPERSIYVQDDVRPYPFEGSVAIHNALVDIYQQLGFEVVEVPFMSLEERVRFIQKKLNL